MIKCTPTTSDFNTFFNNVFSKFCILDLLLVKACDTSLLLWRKRPYVSKKRSIRSLHDLFFSKKMVFEKGISRLFCLEESEAISQIFGLEVSFSLSLVDADHLIITQMSPYQLIS